MWKKKFKTVLPLLGHRNWILVVDKAFPLQSAAGMTFINTGEQLPEVLKIVLQQIDCVNHIKPVIYTDTELTCLNDEMSRGAEALRSEIHNTIKSYASGMQNRSILHDDIFALLNESSKLFSVIVLKTEATTAYSSVFIELDCGYWDADAEKMLRQQMNQ